MIRRATRDDRPALLRMGRSFAAIGTAIPFDDDSYMATVMHLIAGEDAILLVLERDGQVVGMIGGLCYPCWYNHGHITAQELFWWVDEGYRGSGGSVRLLEAFEEWAISQGASEIVMGARSHMSAERLGRFYARRGYVELERLYSKTGGG